MSRAVEITFGDSETLDTDYPLQPCANCGAAPIPNYLLGDGYNIQVTSNGVEGQGADRLSSGSIRLRSLTPTVAFDFSFQYENNGLLQGTFNLPIARNADCPPPQ
jgi:hypothetical protein